MRSDFENLVLEGSQKITPGQIAQFEDKLPMLLARVNDLDLPDQPNFRSQVQFLVRYVEDCLDGKFVPEDVSALAQAIFALMYFDNAVDVIPDMVPKLGLSDDSAVVRVVLLRHGTEFARYGEFSGHAFELVPLDP